MRQLLRRHGNAEVRVAKFGPCLVDGVLAVERDPSVMKATAHVPRDAFHKRRFRIAQGNIAGVVEAVALPALAAVALRPRNGREFLAAFFECRQQVEGHINKAEVVSDLNEPFFVRAERADYAKSRIGLDVGEEAGHDAPPAMTAKGAPRSARALRATRRAS